MVILSLPSHIVVSLPVVGFSMVGLTVMGAFAVLIVSVPFIFKTTVLTTAPFCSCYIVISRPIVLHYSVVVAIVSSIVRLSRLLMRPSVVVAVVAVSSSIVVKLVVLERYIILRSSIDPEFLVGK